MTSVQDVDKVSAYTDKILYVEGEEGTKNFSKRCKLKCSGGDKV